MARRKWNHSRSPSPPPKKNIYLNASTIHIVPSRINSDARLVNQFPLFNKSLYLKSGLFFWGDAGAGANLCLGRLGSCLGR